MTAKRFVIAPLVVLLLGGGVDAARLSPEPVPVSARQAMLRLVKLLQDADLDGARKLSLSYQEFKSVSRRGLDQKEYDNRLDSFLRDISAELRAGVVLEEAICADALILPKSGKTRRGLIMAVIHARFSVPGQTEEMSPLVFTFVDFEGGWKFLLRK